MNSCGLKKNYCQWVIYLLSLILTKMKNKKRKSGIKSLKNSYLIIASKLYTKFWKLTTSLQTHSFISDFQRSWSDFQLPIKIFENKNTPRPQNIPYGSLWDQSEGTRKNLIPKPHGFQYIFCIYIFSISIYLFD